MNSTEIEINFFQVNQIY